MSDASRRPDPDAEPDPARSEPDSARRPRGVEFLLNALIFAVAVGGVGGSMVLAWTLQGRYFLLLVLGAVVLAVGSQVAAYRVERWARPRRRLLAESVTISLGRLRWLAGVAVFQWVIAMILVASLLAEEAGQGTSWVAGVAFTASAAFTTGEVVIQHVRRRAAAHAGEEHGAAQPRPDAEGKGTP